MFFCLLRTRAGKRTYPKVTALERPNLNLHHKTLVWQHMLLRMFIIKLVAQRVSSSKAIAKGIVIGVQM